MSQRDYKPTLHLPQTTFPMHANHRREDPEIIAKWQQDGLYAAAMKLHDGSRRFILHVGPPYANGHLHLGHAYNGILKDILTKARRMIGYHVPIIPGWDCHGLPIELKVTKEHPGLDPLALKAACRRAAHHWIDIQREEFKSLGIVMDWDNPYSTMSTSYEAAGIRAFAALVERGFIARKHKTVAWCTSCMTTLATAEIEYQERKDPSLYVLFTMTHMPRKMRETVAQFCGDEPVHMLVWTTTPWTLPLNRAVAVHPDSSYSLLQVQDRFVVAGSECIAGLRDILGIPVVEHIRFAASLLREGMVQHPCDATRTVPLVFDTMVGMNEGTACVHIAPACGPEDYELGTKQGLEIYGPITPDGRYDTGIVPQALEGMSIQDAQGWVIKSLAERNLLLHKTSLRHSYPHCWRCHQGLIYRATKQWFFELRHDEIQARSLAAIDTIVCNPARGANFLRATIGNRWEWCLSRQRMWGIPIPALLCEGCDAVVLAVDMMERVAQGVAREGVEFWDRVTIEELLAGQTLACQQCSGTTWRKERDILDVWFDSGISHYAVLSQRPDASFPADLYLEGIDQYRGWYQSSLLTSMALSGKPPMRSIMTHGFTVDEHGEKMSKSKGNVVVPQTLLDRYGVDGVRLWVASIDHEHDVVVSEILLKHVEQVMRKVRNTMRFLLQNCFDFDATSDSIAYDDLRLLDRLALLDFVVFHEKMRTAYMAGNVTVLFHGIADYCTTALSAVYCDMSKDRLYVAGKASHERRSVQTVLYRMLDSMTKLLAPILSCTAEQIAQHYRHAWSGSVHLQDFASFDDIVGSLVFEEPDRMVQVRVEPWFVQERLWWEMLLALRACVLKAIEPHREQGTIKHSLQAAVSIKVTPAYAQYSAWQEFERVMEKQGIDVAELIAELCIVSSVKVASYGGHTQHQQQGIVVDVSPARGVKCPRCWRWQESTYDDGLCQRCAEVIEPGPIS